MEPGKNKKAYPQSLSEEKERAFHAYGRLPRGKGLLGQQSKERKYFDSGDFALSAANQATDNGAIQTGTAHPLRERISHPYAPVPNTSNANNDANKDLLNERNPSPEMTDSPLHQRTNMGDGNSGSGKEQSKTSAMTEDIPEKKDFWTQHKSGSHGRLV